VEDGKFGQCPPSIFSDIFPANGRYAIENHTIFTSDGYNLAMFRVYLSENERAKLPADLQANKNKPVLIQHGLFSDSTSMLQSGEKNSFSFYMINKGYDVWLGNNRGSIFSVTTRDPKISSEEFYNYSFEQMGLYDLPAFYTHILSFYSSIPDQKIIYFGHSEGTSQMFVALADPTTKDYMRKHTERFFALSPIVYMTEIHQIAIDLVSKLRGVINFATNILHIWQIGSLNCSFSTPEWNKLSSGMCAKMNFLCDHNDLDPNRYRTDGVKNSLEELDNDGASIKQLVHYGQ